MIYNFINFINLTNYINVFYIFRIVKMDEILYNSGKYTRDQITKMTHKQIIEAVYALNNSFFLTEHEKFKIEKERQEEIARQEKIARKQKIERLANAPPFTPKGKQIVVNLPSRARSPLAPIQDHMHQQAPIKYIPVQYIPVEYIPVQQLSGGYYVNGQHPQFNPYQENLVQQYPPWIVRRQQMTFYH